MAERTLPKIIPVTDEEDAAIRRAITEDPDTWEATGPVKRWKPKTSPCAENVVATLPLDRDVFNALRDAHPDDWEAHANALLKKAVGL